MFLLIWVMDSTPWVRCASGNVLSPMGVFPGIQRHFGSVEAFSLLLHSTFHTLLYQNPLVQAHYVLQFGQLEVLETFGIHSS